MELLNTIINIFQIFRTNRYSNGLVCAHCHSQEVIRYGTYNSKQRYKCNTCKRTFGDFTNSPLNMCHFPDKWPKFIECIIKGLSLRESAVLVGVSYITLFYWRHKLLIALKSIENAKFIGLVEVADIFLPYSLKGPNAIEYRPARKSGRKFEYLHGEKVCVITAIDESKNIAARATLNFGFNKKCVEGALGKLVTEENTMLFLQKPPYSAFCNDRKIKFFNRKTDEPNINSGRVYLCDYLSWMLRFKGIASKYTNSYLSWYKFISGINFDETVIGIKKLITAMSFQYIHQINASIGRQRLATA